MKTGVFILSLMAIFFGGLRFGTKATGSNPRPEGAAVSYEFNYSNTMRYPNLWYEVTRGNDGTVRIAWSRHNEPDITIIRGPEDFFERVDAIVAEFRLYKLKNSYYPRMRVLDGIMWHANICFEKNSISSGGTNAWPPEKLRAGVDAINGYIQSLVDASTEADVIGHDDHDSLYSRKYLR